MDGRREAMAMSGPTPTYYIPGGMAPQGIRPLPNFDSNKALQSSSHIGSAGPSMSSGFQLTSQAGSGVGASGGSSGIGQGEPAKRKRGRPRKYGPDGTVPLALSPLSSRSPGSGTAAGSVVVVSGSGSGSAGPMPKRGRGRPPGTGRKQQLASLGEWVAGSAGMGFTPHIITITVGEDIATKIMSFSQQGPRAVCILSANGAVSRVTLCQPAAPSGTITYEGRFDILCLSGTYLQTDGGGLHSRSGGLSVSLSTPDGRVMGGGVGGVLIAATPVQVIVGTFLHGGTKAKRKIKADNEPGKESEPVAHDKQSTQTGMLPNQNLISSSMMEGWHCSR